LVVIEGIKEQGIEEQRYGCKEQKLPAKMRIFIRDMKSPRCIMKVDERLNMYGIIHDAVQMGYVDIADDTDKEKLALFEKDIEEYQFAVLRNRNEKLAERIVTLIDQRIYDDAEEIRSCISEYLCRHLPHNYTYMNDVFRQVKQECISRYYNLQRMKRAKELVLYGELNFSEIAQKLGYCSMAYFSEEFKRYEGITPTEYRKQMQQRG